MSGTVAVIVVSFERKRMLAECLASIEGADQVILADDGSSFDVEALARQFDLPNLSFVHGPRRSPAERMVTPSCGTLLNRALREVRTDYVNPALCDDDLLNPEFLGAAAAALDANPKFHMVSGAWAVFNDGEQPDPAKLAPITFFLPLTAGNFVYRASCATEEGCHWREDALAAQDGPFLWDYMKVHGWKRNRHPRWLGMLDVLAGYRREHPRTVSNNSLFGADQYLPRTAALFASGSMED